MKKTSLFKMAAVVGLVGVMAITPDLVPTTARIVNGAEASPSEMASTPSDISGGGSSESGTTGGSTTGGSSSESGTNGGGTSGSGTTGGNTSGSGTTNPTNPTNPSNPTPNAPTYQGNPIPAPSSMYEYYGISGAFRGIKAGDVVDVEIGYFSNADLGWIYADTIQWSVEDPDIAEIVASDDEGLEILVKALKKGSTHLRLKFVAEINGVDYSFEYGNGFNVEVTAPFGLSVHQREVIVGDHVQFEIEQLNPDATILDTEWQVTNPDIYEYDPKPARGDTSVTLKGLASGRCHVMVRIWYDINGTKFDGNFGNEIEVVDTGWGEDEIGWYYIEKGAKVTQAWRKSNKDYYYLESDGYWHGWMRDDIGWKFKVNRDFVKNDYRDFEGTSYYLGPDGYRTAPPSSDSSSSSDDNYTPVTAQAPVSEQALRQEYTACAQSVDSSTASGAGWAQDPATGNWTFTLNNVPVVDQMMKIENPYIPGNMAGIFYFDSNGVLASGWKLINGAWYYFNTQHNGWFGAMYVNTITPDGYRVGADGKWIPDQQ